MKKERINILTFGHLGGVLLCTPAFKALKESAPNKKLVVYCSQKGHKQVLLNNPYIDELRGISFWESPWEKILFLLGRFRFIYCNYVTPQPQFYSKSLSAIIGDVLKVQVDDKKPHFCLTGEEMDRAREKLVPYKNVIAFSTGTHTWKNKEWPDAHWAALVRSLPEYTFAQLGLNTEALIPGAIDFRDISIRESVAVIKNSKAYVGIDSFFQHAATAVDVPAFVLFGPTTPNVFGHSVNTNFYSGERCSPCFATLKYRDCPYGKVCMSGITADAVRRALANRLAIAENN